MDGWVDVVPSVGCVCEGPCPFPFLSAAVSVLLCVRAV